MKLIIEISKDDYNKIMEFPRVFGPIITGAIEAIKNGTPLSELVSQIDKAIDSIPYTFSRQDADDYLRYLIHEEVKKC